MHRNVDFEINVHLQPVPQNKLGHKDDYYKIIHDTYVSQYLQALGVEPTEQFRRIVSRNAPLDKCEIEATWTRDPSAVANQLRIMQPLIGKNLIALSSEAKATKSQKAKDLHGRLKLISAAPPDVFSGGYSKPVSSPQHSSDYEQQLAFVGMRNRDIVNSTGTSAELVEELESMRRRACGHESETTDKESGLKQWGEDGARELEDLKRKFILPFAAEKHGKDDAFVCWQSPELQARQLEVPPDHVQEAKHHLTMTLDQIAKEIGDFVDNSFPVELLSTRRDASFFAAIRERLKLPELARLTGLLSHLLYWSALGHLHPAEKRLPQCTRQSLVLSIEELWSQIADPRQKLTCRGETLVKEHASSHCFVVAVSLLALKKAVQRVFILHYPKMFNDLDNGPGLILHLVDQINVLFMNLFDPDCTQVNFAALDSSSDAIRLWKRLHVAQMKLGLTPATRTLAREFRTRPSMLLLMNADGGGPSNAKTRKFLQKSSSDTVLAAVAGFPPVLADSTRGKGQTLSGQVRPNLDQQRRTTLYRSACNRLSAAGQLALS